MYNTYDRQISALTLSSAAMHSNPTTCADPSILQTDVLRYRCPPELQNVPLNLKTSVDNILYTMCLAEMQLHVIQKIDLIHFLCSVITDIGRDYISGRFTKKINKREYIYIFDKFQ